jgi:hypothetical protein
MAPMGMSMVGPVGLVVQDPLGRGRRGRKQARRMARIANGRRLGPVSALVGLVRSAIQSSQGHHQSHPPAPQLPPGSTYH